jgi:hypothetical protein
MLSLSLSAAAIVRGRRGRRPPRGFIFLVDADGTPLTDADGARLIERI